jgi:hypothetical protein
MIMRLLVVLFCKVFTKTVVVKHSLGLPGTIVDTIVHSRVPSRYLVHSVHCQYAYDCMHTSVLGNGTRSQYNTSKRHY